MNGQTQVIVIPILVVVVVLVIMIPLFVYVYKQAEEQKKIREALIKEWDDFVKNGKEIPPALFYDIRQLTLKQHTGNDASQYECEGVFAIAIYDEKRFFVGESKKLFNSIKSQLKGRGNKELFSDLQKNGVIWIKVIAFRFLGPDECKDAKANLVQEYNAKGLFQYGKNKPIESKQEKPRIVEDKPISYLHHKLPVTGMVRIVRQPRGGFIRPSDMEKSALVSKTHLNDGENVHPSLVGLAVDYLSRFMMGESKESAFKISLLGAKLLNHTNRPNFYLFVIKGLDDESIVAAIKLVSYDCVFRAGPHAYVDQSQLKPNKETIQNIREMVNRTIEFWKTYGPITIFGPTFEGGYTDSIATGDGDYLSKDTIWDYKVSKEPPTSKHTFQLLLYYILGIHSVHNEYKNIKYIGIYNPRLNNVYRYSLSLVSEEAIRYIEKEIIGYYEPKA